MDQNQKNEIFDYDAYVNGNSKNNKNKKKNKHNHNRNKKPVQNNKSAQKTQNITPEQPKINKSVVAEKSIPPVEKLPDMNNQASVSNAVIEQPKKIDKKEDVKSDSKVTGIEVSVPIKPEKDTANVVEVKTDEKAKQSDMIKESIEKPVQKDNSDKSKETALNQKNNKTDAPKSADIPTKTVDKKENVNNKKTQQNKKDNKSHALTKNKNKPDKKNYHNEHGNAEPLDNLKKIIDEALDEDINDFVELNSDDIDSIVPENKTEAKKKVNFIIGIMFTFFAVFGFICSIVFSVNLVKNFVDNTKQKNEFAEFIYPIVICDPAPFNDSIKLRNDTMITAAIWDIILYEDKSKYTAEFDYIIVPELDIEQHATKLFGTGLSFTHDSILNSDIQFYYEPEIKSYRIPVNPKYFTYSPVVEDIQKSDNTYTLLVGYLSPSPSWLTMTTDKKPTPDKYVKYIVTEQNGTKCLSAIQQVEESQNSSNNGL